MPLAIKSYKVSAERIPGVASFSHSGTLVIELPGSIRIWIDPPSEDAVVSAMEVSLWIPAGHTVRLPDHQPTITTEPSAGPIVANLVSVGGYRYQSPESSEKVSEVGDSLIGNELIGSTWNTHHLGQHEYSRYNFRIQFDTHPPERFRVSLPSIIVDGKTTQLPMMRVEYLKWTQWMGFNGSIN
jgi:hypothetical protein